MGSRGWAVVLLLAALASSFRPPSLRLPSTSYSAGVSTSGRWRVQPLRDTSDGGDSSRPRLLGRAAAAKPRANSKAAKTEAAPVPAAAKKGGVGEEVIFYPKPIDTAGGDKQLADLSEDDLLYDLFLRQISEINTRAPGYSSGDGDGSGDGDDDGNDLDGGDSDEVSASGVTMSAKLGRILNTKRLIEEPTRIFPDCPIEVIYKRRVVFGNFVSRKTPKGNALIVRLTTGECITVDASQVISSWDMLADDFPPVTPADWAQVAADALQILGNMSPRKSDLQEFWQIISQRSSALPVDSLDLGIYIFQERRFRSWVNPYASAQESAVRALAAGQRYAAALLLYHDDFHFKRRPSVALSEEEMLARDAAQQQADEEEEAEQKQKRGQTGEGGASYSLEDLLSEDTKRRFAASQGGKRRGQGEAVEEDDEDDEDDGEVYDAEADEVENDDSDPLYLLEGAYKCLEENTVLFREEEAFHKYYLQRSLEKQGNTTAASSASGVVAEKAAPFRAGCITRQLRALEMYSMSPTAMTPPTGVKLILKKLAKPASPEGARMVIKDMNIEARVARTSAGQGGEGSSSSTKAPAPLFRSNTPWSAEILAAADELSREVSAKRVVLTDTYSGRAGKRGPSGRMDFRSNNDEHPVICIDGSKAVFLDDAFSLSPETGEILVHVVDVVGTLRRFEILQETAKERISSAFLPTGPMHMLPPQALEALKLSTTGANEVITVGLSVDDRDGTLLGIRVFPSVIGPVFPVDINTADDILDSVNSGDKEEKGWNVRLGYPESVVKDLVTAQRLVEKVIEKQPWADKHFSAGTQRTFSLNKRTGAYKQAFVDKTPGNRMLNALLTLYSNSTCNFCNERGVNVPISWENRDRSDSTLIRRFATQPLRNWLAQLQQKQLRAALKMELPLARKDCAMAVAHHNSRRKQMSSIQSAGRDIMSFESLESHCASVMASGMKEVLLEAEGLGKGGQVKLVDFKVIGMVMQNVGKGVRVRVKVKRVNADTRTVILDLVN